MVQVEGQLMTPLVLPCKAQSTSISTKMILLKDALGIKDGRILSVHEPKTHRPQLLKESYSQARALTKKKKITDHSKFTVGLQK